MADGFMRGFAALGPVYDAEEVFQIGEGPGGLSILAGEYIHRFGRFHLDRFAPVGGGPGRAEVPLKVG
jgi:hypothetical protein